MFKHKYLNTSLLIFYVLKVSKSTEKSSSGKQVTLGVAVSTMMNPDKKIDDDLKTVFDWCKDGDIKRVSQILDNNNVNVDEKDSEV